MVRYYGSPKKQIRVFQGIFSLEQTVLGRTQSDQDMSVPLRQLWVAGTLERQEEPKKQLAGRGCAWTEGGRGQCLQQQGPVFWSPLPAHAVFHLNKYISIV